MNKFMICAALLTLLVICGITNTSAFQFPVSECANGLLNGQYVGCAVALANSIWSIHQWGEATPINICGNNCEGNLKGRISKFRWRWDARFQCTNKGAGIVGSASASGRTGAMQRAIQDWITKAAGAGAINADDFKC